MGAATITGVSSRRPGRGHRPCLARTAQPELRPSESRYAVFISGCCMTARRAVPGRPPGAAARRERGRARRSAAEPP